MRAALILFPYGGVEVETLESVLSELAATPGMEWNYDRVGNDALISRSRSVALSRFLTDGDSEVAIMIDRDIQWAPGDAAATCAKALDTGGLVAGLYAQRAMGAGPASLFRQGGYHVGEDRLWASDRLAGGFLAVPRAALERIRDALTAEGAPEQLRVYSCIRGMTPDGPVRFWDFCRPCVIESATMPGEREYLSEDFALSARAAFAKVPTNIWSRPVLIHHGAHGFTLLEDPARGPAAERGPRVERPAGGERRLGLVP